MNLQSNCSEIDNIHIDKDMLIVNHNFISCHTVNSRPVLNK